MKQMLVYTPFTGLGLYGGFRGNRWLRNRIKVFKDFVIPSLQNQTNQDFIHWISWRPEDITNKHVIALGQYLETLPNYRYVFTYGGICFYDDKYDQKEAVERLSRAFSQTLPTLIDYVAGVDEVQVLLQPSDDLYHKDTIQNMKNVFESTDCTGVGYTQGYLIDYSTKNVLEYNPKTNPPFFAYRIPRDDFSDPRAHMRYISTKVDEGQYPAGTPYPSHEWIPNAFKMHFLGYRGFLVGTHGENISTHFNHPYGGNKVDPSVLKDFGVYDVPPLVLPVSYRKKLMRRLPYRVQRKLRYIFGEVIYQRWYNFLRGPGG